MSIPVPSVSATIRSGAELVIDTVAAAAPINIPLPAVRPFVDKVGPVPSKTKLVPPAEVKVTAVPISLLVIVNVVTVPTVFEVTVIPSPAIMLSTGKLILSIANCRSSTCSQK